MGARLTLIVLAAALALPPAYAAEADVDGAAAKAEGEADSARAADDAHRDKGGKRGGDRADDDLVTCKRDADGMRGPKRSRFMTECLKERR